MESKKRSKLIKSEVANLFKTTKETLRHYEKVGLISPEVDDKHYRYYDVKEMKRLRQIFLFKDLGFTIDQMKEVIDSNLSDDQYKSLLSVQNELLTTKIKHYQTVQQHITQLLELLEENTFIVSFKERVLEEKYYYVFNPFESPFLESMKAYYDEFRTIIESEYYSERSLMSIFPYSSMNKFNKEDSKMCIELDQHTFNEVINTSKYDTLKMASGRYLSVFYIFTDEAFEELDELKQTIDIYINDNNLKLVDDTVIEIEHPELSLSLGENMTVYELQLQLEVI